MERVEERKRHTQAVRVCEYANADKDVVRVPNE